MLTYFLILLKQVSILFILIAVGFTFAKIGIIRDEAIKGITNILLYIAAPCIMIQACQREFDPAMMKSFILVILFGFITIGISFLLSLLVRDEDKGRVSVYRFSIMFTNCAFMCYPVQTTILGLEGLFFGNAYNIVFTVLVWTIGIVMMSHDKSQMSVKNIVKNPGLIGVVIGLSLFLTSTILPDIIETPVEYCASIQTPLAMFITGYHLSKARLGETLKRYQTWLVVVIKLFIVPIIAIPVGLMLGLDYVPFMSAMISAAAPAATMCTIFAVQFDQNAETAVSIMTVTTVLSILTMPLTMAFVQAYVL